MRTMLLKYTLSILLFLLSVEMGFSAVCITTQPTNKSCCTGGSVLFTLGVSGSGHAYQWQYNNVGVWGNVNAGTPTAASYATATNDTLIVSGVTAVGNHLYRCVVSGGGCSDTTSTVTLTISGQPSVPTATSSPLATNVCSGATLTLINPILGSGGVGCSFEYATSINGGGSYSTFSSSVPSLAASGTDNRIRIRSTCTGSGCTSSAPATFTWTVNPLPTAPTATQSPVVTNVCAGSALTLINPILGSGGVGCSFEYATSTNGGGSFSSFSATVPTITATGTNNQIQIRSTCSGNSCGTSSATTYTWTVTPLPTSPTATPSPNVSNVCIGSTLTLTSPTLGSGGIGCGFEYATSTNGGATFSSYSSAIPTITASGTNNQIEIRSVCSGNNCGSTSPTIYTWGVVAQPVAPTLIVSQSVATPLCMGGSVSATLLTAGSGGAGTTADEIEYTQNGSSYFTYSLGTSIVATNVGNGTLGFRTRRTANGSNCSNSGYTYYSYNVVADPAIIFQPLSGAICSGGNSSFTVAISGGTGMSYQWQYFNGSTWSNVGTLPIGAIYSNQTTATLSANGITQTGVASYQCIITSSGNGCTSPLTSNTGSVTVNALPTPTVSSNVAICMGGNTSLVAGGGVGYVWSPSTGLNSQNISNPVASPTVTTTYSVVVTDANNCSATSSNLVVTVHGLPTANVGSATPYCKGGSATLGASGGLSYVWSPSTGLSNSTISNPTASPTATTTYAVIVTDGNGCMDTDNVVVTVKALPIANAGSDVTVCRNISTALNASGGNTYLWLAPTSGLSSPNISNPLATPTTTTTYSVEVTATNGCKDTDQVVIMVNQLPVPSISGTASVCIGLSTPLVGGGGVGYVWSPSTGLNSPFVSNPTASPSGTTTYSFVVTDVNGCTATSGSVVVTVNSLPTANAGSNVPICMGLNTTLGASGGVSFIWSPSTGLSSSTIFNPVASPTTTTTYNVTVTDGNGCKDTDNVVVTVNALPTANAGNDVTVCFGDSAALSGSGGTGFVWNPSTGLSAVNIANPFANPTTQTTYTLQVTDVHGCINTDNVIVSINQLPTPVISGSTSVCKNAYWVNYSANTSTNSYLWSVNGGVLMSGQNTNSIFVHWLNGTTGVVGLKETSSVSGCENTANLPVNISNIAAPDIADIRLKSTDILICTDSTFATYQWGYESIVTRIPVFTCGNTQYCHYTLFDPSSYYYWVIVGNGSGCNTKSYYINPSTGIGNLTLQNALSVYPNPANDRLEIDYNIGESNSDLRVEIFSVLGVKVVSQKLANNYGTVSIDVTSLPVGVYQICLLNGTHQVKSQKQLIVR